MTFEFDKIQYSSEGFPYSLLKRQWVEVDPEGGWKYGFPKKMPIEIYERENQEEFLRWLADNGYPEELIHEDLICRVAL